MRNAFVTALVEAARKDPAIYLITPDLGFSVLEPFAEEFPERFLNCGIAEQNAIGIAAGLALNGMKPYVYSIVPFAVSRPYEQIKVDVAYMEANVKIVGVGAGFAYGPAGATHHALDDIAIMRTLPNMAVVAPGSVNEARELVRYSTTHAGPMYIRLARRGEPDYAYPVEFGTFARESTATPTAGAAKAPSSSAPLPSGSAPLTHSRMPPAKPATRLNGSPPGAWTA